MKAFSFRLEQALRWRSAQLDAEKGQVAAAAAALVRMREERAAMHQELTTAGAELSSNESDGLALAVWSKWQVRTLARIQQLERAEQLAEAELKDRMSKLVIANQKRQVLDNLKADRQAQWRADFGKEVESFAAENFLGRVRLKRSSTSDILVSEPQGTSGARSSGG